MFIWVSRNPWGNQPPNLEKGNYVLDEDLIPKNLDQWPNRVTFQETDFLVSGWNKMQWTQASTRCLSNLITSSYNLMPTLINLHQGFLLAIFFSMPPISLWLILFFPFKIFSYLHEEKNNWICKVNNLSLFS